MNERERLIELIGSAEDQMKAVFLYGTVADLIDMPSRAENVADYLLSHGVTVSQQTEPKTNGDRIREMDDEELAEFLTHTNATNCQDCAFAVGWRCHPDRDDYSEFDKCKEGRKRWLKQPAKEEV